MSISIIGGSGFLGHRISKRLREANVKHKSLDRKFVKNHANFVDVTDLTSLDILEGSNAIINLAAVHRDDVKPITLYDDVNVQGAKNMFGCRKI